MKLLICDDDISTIDVLESQLDWRGLGIDILLRAYNGIVAKEIILAQRPELILCDIGMPLCNGMQVLRFLSEQGIKSNFAFLTCYESFEYAREAVRYGAVNYLTKPLDLDEVRESLRVMAAASLAEKQATDQNQEGSSRLSAAVNTFLRSLREGVHGNDPDSLDQILQKENIPLRARDIYRQVHVCVDPTRSAQYRNDPHRTYLERYRSLCQEVISKRGDNGFIIADGGGVYYRLTLFIPEEQCGEADVHQRCRNLIQRCTAELGITPTCLIACPIPLFMLPDVHFGLRRLLQKLRFCAGQVIKEQDIAKACFEGAVYELNQDQVLASLNHGNREGYMRIVSDALDRIIGDRRNQGGDQQMALLHHDLLQCFYKLLQDNHIQPHCLFQTEEIWDMNFNAERSVQDMLDYASCLFETAVQTIRGANSQSNVIHAAKQFIQGHFHEDIDRDDVAEMVCITPNYLSKRFHCEVGIGLREYINQLRIAEAKRLLISTNKQISEVACDIGFKSISYFSTVFHKQCGISPMEWRDQAGADLQAGPARNRSPL